MSTPKSQKLTVEGSKWGNLNGSHGNAFAHQSLMDQWRDRALVARRAAKLLPMDTPVVITATVHRTTNAHADSHNVTPTIKACIDALITPVGGVKVLPDDCDCHCAVLRIVRGPKRSQPTITLTIETQEKS